MPTAPHRLQNVDAGGRGSARASSAPSANWCCRGLPCPFDDPLVRPAARASPASHVYDSSERLHGWEDAGPPWALAAPPDSRVLAPNVFNGWEWGCRPLLQGARPPRVGSPGAHRAAHAKPWYLEGGGKRQKEWGRCLSAVVPRDTLTLTCCNSSSVQHTPSKIRVPRPRGWGHPTTFDPALTFHSV